MGTHRLPDRPYSPPPPSSVKLVHEDAAIVVADKPSGLLSVAGRGESKQISALSYLMEDHGALHVVHRLDMDTSGLIVFAKTQAAQRILSDQFANRKVAKTYHARVHGEPCGTSGTVTLPIGRDWTERPLRRVDHEAGKPAITLWTKLSSARETSLVRLEPETGRTHQLRVHMAALGHPIVGDRLYGLGDPAEPLLLHASGLRFTHPQNAVEITLSAPIPFA